MGCPIVCLGTDGGRISSWMLSSCRVWRCLLIGFGTNKEVIAKRRSKS